jgi:signal transduction histidine kinase
VTTSSRALLIKHKLHLLTAVPLAGMVLATAPLVLERVHQSSQASGLATQMDTADRIGSLVQDVQRERLVAIEYLAAPQNTPNALLVQSALVEATATDLRHAPAARLTPAMSAALAQVAGLDTLRPRILARSITPNRLNAAFDTPVGALIDSLGLSRPQALGADGAAAESALDALFRADQYRITAGAALLAAVATPAGAAGALGTIDRAEQAENVEVARFRQLATPQQTRLFQLARFGTASALVGDLQEQIEPAHGASPGPTAQPAGTEDRVSLVDSLADAVSAQYGLRVMVEEKIAHDIAADAENVAHRQFRYAAGFTIAIEALSVIVVVLTIRIRRSVAQPLQHLTQAASEVASLAEAELRHVADTDEHSSHTPLTRLADVKVAGRDEMGTLAEAFNRVQAASTGLLERQIISRRNVAAMFASVGHRTLNLVRQQLALIDALEAEELDEDRLENLFLLDHFATRLQRSANSLIVLSGTSRQSGGVSEPVSLRDAIRAAGGSIDDYRRIQVGPAVEDLLRAGPAGDIVLLLSELLANAVQFSGPERDVEVTAFRSADQCCVRIIDHGIGMPPERMERENLRLISRERLDLAPTDLLGLFVVGRLARRHGLAVTLTETDGGGVTVLIVIPDPLFISSPEPAVAAATPGADNHAGIGAEDTAAEAIQRAVTFWRDWQGQSGMQAPGTPAKTGGWQPAKDPAAVPFALQRRTPGAQRGKQAGNLTDDRTERPPPRVVDPQAVRAELEAFQRGVARAASNEQCTADAADADADAAEWTNES